MAEKKKRIIFKDWEQLWESKYYDVKLLKKKFYVCRFHLLQKPKAKDGKTYKMLLLWVKDYYAPGKPCYYLQVPIFDLTTNLQWNLEKQKEWKSDVFKVNRKFNTVMLAQLFLKFKKCKNGTVRPQLRMKLKAIYEPGQPSYFAKLNVTDFRELNQLLLTRYRYKKYKTRVYIF